MAAFEKMGLFDCRLLGDLHTRPSARLCPPPSTLSGTDVTAPDQLRAMYTSALPWCDDHDVLRLSNTAETSSLPVCDAFKPFI